MGYTFLKNNKINYVLMAESSGLVDECFTFPLIFSSIFSLINKLLWFHIAPVFLFYWQIMLIYVFFLLVLKCSNLLHLCHMGVINTKSYSYHQNKMSTIFWLLLPCIMVWISFYILNNLKYLNAIFVIFQFYVFDLF